MKNINLNIELLSLTVLCFLLKVWKFSFGGVLYLFILLPLKILDKVLTTISKCFYLIFLMVCVNRGNRDGKN